MSFDLRFEQWLELTLSDLKSSPVDSVVLSETTVTSSSRRDVSFPTRTSPSFVAAPDLRYSTGFPSSSCSRTLETAVSDAATGSRRLGVSRFRSAGVRGGGGWPASIMGDVHHSGGGGGAGAKKKKSGAGQNKSYYYSLTYDDDDAGSLDYTVTDDDLQKRVASILAETEIDVVDQDGRLDLNDNLFGGGGGDGSRINSRNNLDFEFSDDGEVDAEEEEEGEEFQSADESKSDTFRPDPETTSIEDDFVRITRPYVGVGGGGGGEARRHPGAKVDGSNPADDDVFASGAMMTLSSSSSEQSPKATSGPVKHTGSSPLSVVYVKQKPSTELYDGNFIDDDILQPQDDRTLDDNISQGQ